jgi:hypothetical protein
VWFLFKNVIFFLFLYLHSKYGTFFHDYESERIKKNLKNNMLSLWTFFAHHKSLFLNPFYEERGDLVFFTTPKLYMFFRSLSRVDGNGRMEKRSERTQ